MDHLIIKSFELASLVMLACMAAMVIAAFCTAVLFATERVLRLSKFYKDLVWYFMNRKEIKRYIDGL